MDAGRNRSWFGRRPTSGCRRSWRLPQCAILRLAGKTARVPERSVSRAFSNPRPLILLRLQRGLSLGLRAEVQKGMRKAGVWLPVGPGPRFWHHGDDDEQCKKAPAPSMSANRAEAHEKWNYPAE